jgi:hypothetical protein
VRTAASFLRESSTAASIRLRASFAMSLISI